MKENFIKVVEELKKTNTLTDEFLKFMHEYYLDINKEKYNSRNRLENFISFKEFLINWIHTPIIYEENIQEMIFNKKNIDISKAIKKTILYFNKKYNI